MIWITKSLHSNGASLLSLTLTSQQHKRIQFSKLAHTRNSNISFINIVQIIQRSSKIILLVSGLKTWMENLILGSAGQANLTGSIFWIQMLRNSGIIWWSQISLKGQTRITVFGLTWMSRPYFKSLEWLCLLMDSTIQVMEKPTSTKTFITCMGPSNKKQFLRACS